MKKKISLLMLAFCTLAMGYVKAQESPMLVATVDGYKEFVLANGLRVVLLPDASQSNIAVNIVYKVGSRHEGYGESGMAHLLEHMLFKQCENIEDIKKAIADRGASANGTTYYDRTNYYEVLSASEDNLKWALDMEADRMVNSKILKEELAKEFSVVRNEFEIGENNQFRVLLERVLSTMFLWHNYGKSTIGSKEDIERVDVENLRAFYRKYYQPDNAVLFIAGKFDEAKALEFTQNAFGKIPKPTRVLQPTYTVEPTQDGERYVALRRTGDIQYIGMAYHTPPLADADYVANLALTNILSSNPTGVFYKELVETKLATSIFASPFQLHDPGITYFGATLPKEVNVDSVRFIMAKLADEIGNMVFTEADLERAKNNLLKSYQNLGNNVISLAINLTEYEGAGDWRLFFLERDRLEKLNLSDLQAVASKYYKASNRTVGIFKPEENPQRVTVSETPDIAKLLEGYSGKEAVAQKEAFENTIANIKKNTEYGKLANGGQYALLFKPTKGDKINASITLQYGNESNLMNRSLAARLLGQMLKRGTTNRTKEQIKDDLDKIKSDIGFSGSATGLNISISTDKANLPKALEILEDLLKNPKFDEKEFEQIVLATKTDLEANKTEPDAIVGEKLGKMTSNYPKGHPFYASSSDEDLEDLAKVKLEDLKKFYKDFYGANNSVSTFVGEIDKTVIKNFLNKNFAKWNSKLPYARIYPKYFETKGTVEKVNTPDKTNAVAVGAINIPVSQKSEDYAALYFANELLGGGAFLNSRIPQRLRENEGMSYGAGSYMDANYKEKVGSIGVYAYFNPIFQGRLDSALNEEVDKALTEGFTADELSKSIGSWLEGNRTSLGSNGFLASTIKSYMRDGRDLNEFTDFENKVQALKVEMVNAALKKYFDKKKLILLYGGDFEKAKSASGTEKKGF